MRPLFLLATLPLLVVHLAMADDNGNFAVGTCKPGLTSFPNIQTAVTTVPPGSRILVCPGTYAEQVTISQPLTLQGIASGNLDQAVITVPNAGLNLKVTSIAGEPVAAQVLVQNASGVNLNNIVIDGTGGDQSCSTTGTWLAGIFYASNSSGSVNRVRTSGQTDGGCGVGIWAENGASGTYQSISVTGSSVHDADGVGISLMTQTPPTLTVDIENNYISSQPSIGIFAVGVDGSITDNDVADSLVGIFDWAAARFSSNHVTSTMFAVALLSPGTVQSNAITNSGNGVYLEVDGANIQSNHITLASVAAVEFNCHTANVSENRINDAAIGLNNVPPGFNGSNNFFNTSSITSGTCPPALASLATARTTKAVGVAANKPSSFSRWRTPANPKGLHP